MFGLVSCGGGSSSSSSNITISASVGSGYTVALAEPSLLDQFQDMIFGKRAVAIATDATVDKVVAIPTSEGSYGPAMLEIMSSSDIAIDGSFSLSLDRNYEWVLLLVNSAAATKDEEVVGYVAATVEADNTLVAFSGNVLSSALDLGTLSKTVDEARSSRSAADTAASFSMAIDDLKSVARSDGSYKHLINLYLNYNPVTKESYLAQLQYNWLSGSIAATGNTDPLATAISSYQPNGFDVTIETSVISESLKDGICGMTTAVELAPPGNVSNADASVTWTSASGFKNDGIAAGCSDTGCNNMGPANAPSWLDGGRFYCYDADFGAQITTDFSNSLIGFGFGDIQIPGSGMPQGLWVYSVDGIEVAWFDLAVASPVSISGVFDTTPIPGIRVNHNSNGEITGLAVKWFQYDAMLGQYVALTNSQITALDSIVRDTFIDVMDEDGAGISNPDTIHLYANGSAEISSTGLIDGSTLTFPTGSDAWYLPGSTGDVTGNIVPTHIRVGMHMGGSLYNFSWI